jgi:hypothetical protein
MPENMKHLPTVLVPDQLYELIRLYAFQNKMSMGAGIRELLKNSPALMDLASEQAVDLSQAMISEWGGKRTAAGSRSSHDEYQQIIRAGRILVDLDNRDEEQIDAIHEMLKFAPNFRNAVEEKLREGLRIHLNTYGPVQKALVEAIREIGDVWSVPYLLILRENTKDPNVHKAIYDAIEIVSKRRFTGPRWR